MSSRPDGALVDVVDDGTCLPLDIVMRSTGPMDTVTRETPVVIVNGTVSPSPYSRQTLLRI